MGANETRMRRLAAQLPRVGCDWLSRGAESQQSTTQGLGWIRYRNQLFDSPNGKLSARIGPDRRRLVLSHGDLVTRGGSAAAIVTPANAHLAGNANPSGWVFRDQKIGSFTKGEPLRNVDGAVHSAAGSRLLAACQALPTDSDGLRCPVGAARATDGFDLPAETVIHCVGPRDRDEATLQRAHMACLTLAEAKGLKTV